MPPLRGWIQPEHALRRLAHERFSAGFNQRSRGAALPRILAAGKLNAAVSRYNHHHTGNIVQPTIHDARTASPVTALQ